MDFQRKLYGKVIATLKSKKILAKVKVIDFLLNLSYDREIITSKKYLKLANRIDDITKYTTGWLSSMANTKNKVAI